MDFKKTKFAESEIVIDVFMYLRMIFDRNQMSCCGLEKFDIKLDLNQNLQFFS